MGEPSATAIIKICQFFEISIDDFLKTDLEKVDLIAKPDEKLNSENVDLIHDPMVDLIKVGEYLPAKKNMIQSVSDGDLDQPNSLLEYVKKITEELVQTRVLLTEVVSDMHLKNVENIMKSQTDKRE